MTSRTLNVALVGFGYAGRTFHAPLIAAVPTLRLHTVISSRPGEIAPLYPQTRVVADLDAALSDPAIDLVVVATPNALHAPMAERALEAGKHVVVDKPFTLSVAEAERLKTLAEARGLVLSVFHNRRWDADFLAVQALIAEGRLGEIVRFESHFDRFRPQRRDRWRERDEPGAGIWYDLGPHLIDQALVLFGMPLGITADIGTQRPGDGAADHAHAILRYERLRVVLHADMMSAAQPFRFAVHGERGSFVTAGLDPQEDTLKAGGVAGGPGWGVDPAPGRIVGEDGSQIVFAGPDGDYRLYYSAVAEAVTNRAPNPVTPDQAIAVMTVIEAGLESSARRAEVPV